jgi:hypothetical protein
MSPLYILFKPFIALQYVPLSIIRPFTYISSFNLNHLQNAASNTIGFLNLPLLLSYKKEHLLSKMSLHISINVIKR